MKEDITCRQDIQILADNFYNKVKEDTLIGKFFTEVVKVNWDKHLPQMYDFWESILFAKSLFSGNPMRKHIELGQKSPLNKVHFDHWLEIFNTTVDELFSGVNTERIKTYAATIKENLSLRATNSDGMNELIYGSNSSPKEY